MNRSLVTFLSTILVSLSGAAVAQDDAAGVSPNKDLMAAAFAVDYDAMVEKASNSLSTNMNETVRCAGDLILMEMASNDGAPVFKEMAFIYMERGQLLRKSGQEMIKADRKWMKAKKWNSGIPKSFDAYGKPRFDDSDEAGKKAFLTNAENCRVGMNAALNETEMAAIALRAALGSIG